MTCRIAAVGTASTAHHFADRRDEREHVEVRNAKQVQSKRCGGADRTCENQLPVQPRAHLRRDLARGIEDARPRLAGKQPCEGLKEEQRSPRGCIARRMQPDFYHGLLGAVGHLSGQRHVARKSRTIWAMSRCSTSAA